jgi:ubiquinone/menaquinone biosynthesis C-methylase UbiE
MQRRYFAEVSHLYDARAEDEYEHYFALAFLTATIDHFGYQSVLDIGSGTGRAISYLKSEKPNIRVVGIEPVKELREVAYGKGISRTDLLEGDGTKIQFSNAEFDVVCEFGVLHHVQEPSRVVAEMLRVAKKAIFISDSNNFGQGGTFSRVVKQALNTLGLWKVANLIKTGGRGYSFSEGDGVFYSYSAFSNYDQIKNHCQRIHVLNTNERGWGVDPYKSASHVALLGILK